MMSSGSAQSHLISRSPEMPQSRSLCIMFICLSFIRVLTSVTSDTIRHPCAGKQQPAIGNSNEVASNQDKQTLRSCGCNHIFLVKKYKIIITKVFLFYSFTYCQFWLCDIWFASHCQQRVWVHRITARLKKQWGSHVKNMWTDVVPCQRLDPESGCRVKSKLF